MNQIEKALDIALKAHAGEKDLDGNPVILHPLTVGMNGRIEAEKVAGFLHDVVEDTGWTFDDLLREGISEEVVDALRLLTHDKSISYKDYVQHIAQSNNPTAIWVKYCDLTHNLQRGRAGGHWEQVAKHEKAYEVIKPIAIKLPLHHNDRQ